MEKSEGWTDVAQDGPKCGNVGLVKQNNSADPGAREPFRNPISAPAHGEDGPVRPEGDPRKKPDRRGGAVRRLRTVQRAAVPAEDRMRRLLSW